MAPASKTSSEPVYTLLFVDDEANILSALTRLFRPFGYRILTAESGAQGLEIMASETVDLVVSDMRMPEMNGSQFFEKVREKWPKPVRILLTGYAEIGATIDAINKGEIYRYISKPWEDNDILLVIKHALEQKALQQKHDKLEFSFMTTIRIFSNLTEMREGGMAGHSRRVAELARSIAQHMGLNKAEVQDVLIAGLLHDVGKIGLPDRLLKKPFTSLNHEERLEVIKHPLRGQAALMAVEQFQGAGKLIRAQLERFDGLGFPDQLVGQSIPLGARILTLASDYDSAQFGTLLPKRLTQDGALAFIEEGRGRRYDPTVVDAFIAVMGGSAKKIKTMLELALRTEQIRPGMVISRDLLNKQEYLLLEKGYILDEKLIEQIINFERLGDPLLIYIRTER